jgi:cysteinyl-tRNA synthetase
LTPTPTGFAEIVSDDFPVLHAITRFETTLTRWVAGPNKTSSRRRSITMHMLVRHKVADFAKWKPVYDAHLSARQKAGLKEEHLFRNADDQNEVLLLFSVEDVDKAKAFTASDDLRQAMEKAGVSDKPDVYFLE